MTDANASRQVPGVGLIEYEEKPRRRYWFTPTGGERQVLQSVTTILGEAWPKPHLINWAARQGPDGMARVRKGATERGKAVHLFVETYMATSELLPERDFEPEHRPYLTAAARFLFEHDPEPEAVEQLVCHPELAYAGRLDLRARIHRHSTIVDFKTSNTNRIYPEAHVQATAYALADEACGAPPVQDLLLVAFGPDGQYTAVPGTPAFDCWGALLTFHQQRQRLVKAIENGH